MLPNSILAIALLLSGASLFAAAVLWKKLSAAHRRIHRLERAGHDTALQLASLSRSASRTEAGKTLVAPESEAVCHAQHGEEFFLWERLGFKGQGSFIEIGAYDGVSLSNSLFFEQMGWRGMLVEAHPELAEQCRLARPNAKVVHAALGPEDGGTVTFSMVRGERGLDTLSFVSTTDQHRNRIESHHGNIEQVTVPARTLRSVMKEAAITEVDWISVDVEGAELEVLKGADLEAIRPKIILVEDNSGGMDSSVADFLRAFGYRREQTVGCNDMYVYAG